MKGDFTRLTFDPRKHYSRVLMQQGRVQLDADWNELVEMQVHFLRTLATDIIGPHGGPEDNFLIDVALKDGQPVKQNFAIAPGHYYVDGIVCENDVALLYDGQVGFSSPPFDDLDGNQNRSYLVYLDVWERHVTYIEDADENRIDIREVALRRPDTTTRTQIVWHVHCLPLTITPIPDYKSDAGYTAFLKVLVDSPQHIAGLSSGRLRARAIKPASADNDPCLTAPEARYRGVENQLYRVEIHDGGELGKATFKWSRENGAVIFPITNLAGKSVTLEHLGADERFGLPRDGWVEIVDDDYVLQHRVEPLLQIAEIDPDTLQVTLKENPATNVGSNPTKHPLLRRWDSANVGKVEIPASNDGWIMLEDGVEIHFDGDEQSRFRSGDYWLIPARVATGDVEWPGTPGAPHSLAPHGVVHHYAPLAFISLAANGAVTIERDYRRTIQKIAS